MCTKFGSEIMKRRDHSRPWHRREDNIKLDFREIGLEGVDWMHKFQDRDQWQASVNLVMNLLVP
jgi:hypothetical protein